MKMIITIVQDEDANKVSEGLVAAGIQATRLATTGGFLKAGNTTFMIGVGDERVEETLAIIKANAQARDQVMTTDMSGAAAMMTPVQVQVGGATVFVQDVEQFHQF